MSALQPAVFLDRDGTLNKAIVRDGKPYPPATPGEFVLLPGVAAGCARLKAAGFLLVVATNQPDVGRGTQSREVVESIHARMLHMLPIDRVEACYHPGQGVVCDCRKPAPGMLLRAADEMGIDLARSWMVGDRWRDVDCGAAAGCRTVFIEQGYDEKLRTLPDFSVCNFLEAVDTILLHSTLHSSIALGNQQRQHSQPSKPSHTMTKFESLKIQIYADGADKAGIVDLYSKPYIKGLTTNPTLMNKAGIKDYEAFARDILQVVTQKPLSLEVFSDDFAEMKRQALKIAAWGKNVYVKIPITNSTGQSCIPLIGELAAQGVQLNVTAILTLAQVRDVGNALNGNVPSIVSVFAGRIADTGCDPMPIMRAAKVLLEHQPKAELLWASVREPLNIVQAEESGCDIVTVPHDILGKAAKMFGMDHTALSLDTVKMFAKDAQVAGFVL